MQQEKIAASALNGDGYMTAVYNMLFLLQTRIVKMMRGEIMDEELFR